MSAEAKRSSFRLWLDLARAGNFPSVWSNVLAALVLSMPVAVRFDVAHGAAN